MTDATASNRFEAPLFIPHTHQTKRGWYKLKLLKVPVYTNQALSLIHFLTCQSPAAVSKLEQSLPCRFWIPAYVPLCIRASLWRLVLSVSFYLMEQQHHSGNVSNHNKVFQEPLQQQATAPKQCKVHNLRVICALKIFRGYDKHLLKFSDHSSVFTTLNH